MGDTSNWEFAAAVAAISIGLGGLLLFTILGTIGSWQVFARAGRASSEAAKAAIAVQDLARYLSAREAAKAAEAAAEMRHVAGLSDLRSQADALMEQQARLQDAVRQIVEAGAQRTEESGRQLEELDAAVQRLNQNLGRVASAIARLDRRP